MEFELWCAGLAHYIPLIHQVIEQTARRVFDGEQVPANEKLFSLFEEHTDIIVKGSRDIQYGHKLNLSGGKSGLILDVVIEQGNPADSTRFIPMLERHVQCYGCPPRQVAADGGYGSTDNLREEKEMGVQDVAFHKKRGLSVLDMVNSQHLDHVIILNHRHLKRHLSSYLGYYPPWRKHRSLNHDAPDRRRVRLAEPGRVVKFPTVYELRHHFLPNAA